MPRTYSMFVVLVLGTAAFVLQLVDVWPLLATRATALVPAALIHAGAVLSLVSVFFKLRRKEPVLVTDVLMVAFMMLFSWSAYLRLVQKFAFH